MKHNITLLCMLVMLTWVACSGSRKEEPAGTPPPADKTVVADTVHTDVQKEGTSIKISDQGMSIESKDGSKKTNVKISGDSSNLEITRPK